ncbi:MAG: CHAT domain-containing protein, partial [Cyanobacteria bacterium HKST-UBA02]|nr:CHAT domain-containing protein [Cyanobacteria bacterium HKST-UBA02]
QGRYADAEPLYKEALAIRKKALGDDHPDTARSMNNLAFLYQAQGRYADAEPLYKEGQSVNHRNFGKPMISETLLTDQALREIQDLQGLFLKESGDGLSPGLYDVVRRLKGCQKFPDLDFTSLPLQSPQQLAIIELALSQKSLDNPNFDIVNSLLSIKTLQESSASPLSLSGALADLLIANRLESLDGQSKNLAEETAKSLESLAKESIKSLKSGSAGKDPNVGPVSTALEALCRMLLCNAYLIAENGNREEATAQANLAARLIEAVSQNRVLDSANIAELHIDSATFFKLVGNYGQARVHLDDANTIVSRLMSRLERGDDAGPGARHDASTTLSESKIASLQVRVLLALCELAFQQEDYHSALELGSETLSLAALKNPKLLHDRIKLLLLLSQSAIDTGDGKQGLDFAKDATELAKTDVDKDADMQVAAEIAYARALASDGRTGDAIAKLQKCLTAATDSSPQNNDTNVRGSSQSADNKTSKASVNRELIAELYSALAECQLDEKDFKEARLSFSHALDITRKSKVRSAVSSRIDEIFGIALCDAGLNDRASASSLAYQAAGYLNSYINDVFPDLSFAEQRSFVQKIKDYSSRLLALCHEEDQMSTTYWYLMRWRGLLVEALRRQSLLGAKANDPDPKVASDYSQWLATKSEISRISSAALNDKQIRSQLQELTKTKESLERRLLGSDNVVDPLAKLSIADFQKSLSEDEAVVELYTYELVEREGQQEPVKQVQKEKVDQLQQERNVHHCAIVITHAGITFVDIPEAKAISNAIRDWRDVGLSTATRGDRDIELVGAAGEGSRAKAIEKADRAWQILQSQLWKPILKTLPGNCSRLIVCDDEDLSRIPWSKLANDDSDGRYFLVARVDSPRELVVLKSSSRSNTKGAPTALNKRPTPVSVPDTSKPEFLLVGDIDYKDHRLRLAGTAAEIAAIEKLAEGTGGALSTHLTLKPLTGKEPTREKVLEHLPKAKIAHLATHGFFAESEANQAGTRGRSRALVRSASTAIGSLAAARNPLVSSGILLAAGKTLPGNDPGNARGEVRDRTEGEAKTKNRRFTRSDSTSISTNSGDVYIEDEGKLTAEELVNLDLRNCDLIVLSACDTGRGTEERGQGVLGLRSAIMSAGARTLIISLWPVDDDATRFLMTEFYRQVLVNGKSKAEALRAAKEAIRDSKENPKWQHPYYWAAWALVGEGW